MLLVSDAVTIFVKGLAELNIVEELEPVQLQCRKRATWSQGRKIIEFIKAVRKTGKKYKYRMHTKKAFKFLAFR